MPAYLKIESVGVCPVEGFTVLSINLTDTSENDLEEAFVALDYRPTDEGE
jgi:hypothetical protein